MKVRDVMTRGAECVGPDDSLQEAARKMKELDIGPLPVCDNDRLAGMVGVHGPSPVTSPYPLAVLMGKCARADTPTKESFLVLGFPLAGRPCSRRGLSRAVAFSGQHSSPDSALPGRWGPCV